MVLAKLQDGHIMAAANVVHHDIEGKEYITTNPTETLLRSLGYKTLVVEEKPEITQYQLVNEHFSETADTITQGWEISDKPIINDPEPQEMMEGYELQEYEYVTPTEVHRGKRLVPIAEVVEGASEMFQESDGASSESEDNGSIGSGDNLAD